jgi:cytoskeleton protein RodZ
MNEASPAPVAAPERVGGSLRAARERMGLSLAEVASRTRVPLRHLEAIEAGDYSGLPSHTYATGFVKAYARAVGADEVALTRRLRGELAQIGPRTPEYQPYEAPDPARVPSRALTIVTLGLAVAAIIAIGLWYAGVLTAGSARDDAPIAAAPATPPNAAPSVAATATPAGTPTPAPATGGHVALATTGRVWMKVHDGDKTLYLGTMNPGEHFDVPADATDPLVDIGRPDKLTVTLDGRALPTLPPSDHPMMDLRVGPAAVAARLAGGVAPAAAAGTPLHRDDGPRAERRRPSHANRAEHHVDETARANLDAARDPPPAVRP